MWPKSCTIDSSRSFPTLLPQASSVMRVSWNQSPDKINVAAGPAQVPQGGRRGSDVRAKVNAPVQRKRGAIHQHKREDKLHAVQEAKKKVAMKTNADKGRPQVKVQHTLPFVYVGNLQSSITEERLRAMFAPCGSICRIGIRCSRGQAVTIGVPVPASLLTSRDRQYASIEFHNLEAAKLALRLNGARVDGLEIVVTSTPANLPEVQDIVRTRIKQKKGNLKKGLLNQFKLKLGFNPIRVEPTEEFPPQDRHRALGISFAKCLA
ncbi:hypothetical protein FPV67DRAFT_1471300 [Lyophyllum atratum]|nr:hypothetical protein FPV67DRAFT_1471300 [Lyophyllum atratum]